MPVVCAGADAGEHAEQRRRGAAPTTTPRSNQGVSRARNEEAPFVRASRSAAAFHHEENDRRRQRDRLQRGRDREREAARGGQSEGDGPPANVARGEEARQRRA